MDMGEKPPPLRRGFNFSRRFEFRAVKDIHPDKYGAGDFEKINVPLTLHLPE
jgi:hypothetical protein